MKSKDLQPRLLYPEKLSFRIEGEIKYFQDKVELKEFIITKPLLHKMLKGLIEEDQNMNIKKATNSQLSTTESKNKTKQTRTGTES